MAATTSPINMIYNVALPGTDADTRWDLFIGKGRIMSTRPHDPEKVASVSHEEPAKWTDGHGALLAPSLCHPHVHIDKAYLLSHPRYAHLQIEEGSFQEAMTLTNKAKEQFEHADLLERGQRLIDESLAAGVTAMRAFVEVDPIVEFKCLKAGKQLKDEAARQHRCDIQLCIFAQLPLYPGKDGIEGEKIRRMMRDALRYDASAAIGSTPYVEDSPGKMKDNVEWMVDLAIENNRHLDFHLDYNLDPNTEPLVWHVIKTLKQKKWTELCNKTVVLGHCTRLSLFKDWEWAKLKEEIGDLPISFVGLPTSDLFMMRTETGARGTLSVPTLIKKHGLDAAIGINNIGNAFTPQGSCDPLSIASLGVGVYQAGTKRDTEILYECVSTRARVAIGLARPHAGSAIPYSLGVESQWTNEPADLLLFARDGPDWKTRRSISDAVYLYDGARGRTVLKSGAIVR